MAHARDDIASRLGQLVTEMDPALTGSFDSATLMLKPGGAGAEAGRMLEPRRPRLSYVFLAIFLLAAVTAARFAATNGVDAIGFLFVLPVAILAAELRWRGALAGTAAAVGLTAFWSLTEGVPLSPIGYAVRIFTLGAVGLGVDRLLEQRDHLARAAAHERETLLAEVRRLADTDELTGLANRRAWRARLTHEIQRARRTGEALAVVVVDLDGFKSVNDSLGHRRGDELLQSCASRWRPAVRVTDLLARVGGDEFAVVLPACDESGTLEVMERLRATAPHGAPCSVGFALWDGTESEDSLVDRADRQLYVDKGRAGRVQRRAASPV
jgi:diguanylate cyclase (GGDEF)-like protein